MPVSSVGVSSVGVSSVSVIRSVELFVSVYSAISTNFLYNALILERSSLAFSLLSQYNVLSKSSILDCILSVVNPLCMPFFVLIINADALLYTTPKR